MLATDSQSQEAVFICTHLWDVNCILHTQVQWHLDPAVLPRAPLPSHHAGWKQSPQSSTKPTGIMSCFSSRKWILHCCFWEAVVQSHAYRHPSVAPWPQIVPFFQTYQSDGRKTVKSIRFEPFEVQSLGWISRYFFLLSIKPRQKCWSSRSFSPSKSLSVSQVSLMSSSSSSCCVCPHSATTCSLVKTSIAAQWEPWLPHQGLLRPDHVYRYNLYACQYNHRHITMSVSALITRAWQHRGMVYMYTRHMLWGISVERDSTISRPVLLYVCWNLLKYKRCDRWKGTAAPPPSQNQSKIRLLWRKRLNWLWTHTLYPWNNPVLLPTLPSWMAGSDLSIFLSWLLDIWPAGVGGSAISCRMELTWNTTSSTQQTSIELNVGD